MPLFQRQDPDLRSLIAYLVAGARGRDVTLNQTKLVKLLYLIDVERAASGRESLTGLRWVFYHYGPYALELPEIIEAMEGKEIIVQGWKDARLFRAAPGAPSGDDWPPATRRLVDLAIRRYAALGLNELLDFVYFHTAPMKDVNRGEELDMSKARTEPEPRALPALDAPEFPAEAMNRLAAWKAQRKHDYVPISRDDRLFFIDPDDEDIPLDSTRGRINVPDNTEL